MTNLIMTSYSIDELRTQLIEPLAKDLQELRTHNQEPETVLSRKEAAKFLGVTLVTLHDWTKRGLIDCGRIGVRVFYKKSELLNAITRNQVCKADNYPKIKKR